MSAENKRIITNLLKLTGITIAVYALMRYIFPIVVPFLVAFLIAVLLHPLVERIAKKVNISKRILSSMTLFLAVLLVAGILVTGGYKLLKEIGNLVAHYRELEQRVMLIWEKCCTRIENITGCPTGMILEYANTCMENCSASVQEKIIPCVMNWSMTGMKGAFTVLGKVVVTIVAALLFLIDYDKICQKASEHPVGIWLASLGEGLRHMGGTYLRAQLIIMGMVMATCVIGLFFTGNPYALVAGILIGVCDALPFLGTGTVFVPWIIITVFRGKYGLAVGYGVIYIICSIIREYVEPRLVGRGLGIHPLAVMIAVYIGICLFSAWGIILGPLAGYLILHIYKQIAQ